MRASVLVFSSFVTSPLNVIMPLWPKLNCITVNDHEEVCKEKKKKIFLTSPKETSEQVKGKKKVKQSQ
jgi:hypothetical protein